ncbi:ABC transporter substrate-binding protein [Vibrio sp. RC586]|uniref:ABC transporter substrate-binding protein n=1 Tax=Vibrio sp. RC586 TaxID=675815 RepID=UPI00050CA6EB|nr:ABC transporter substrate-binding protein [Vibrio sp. RC586]
MFLARQNHRRVVYLLLIVFAFGGWRWWESLMASSGLSLSTASVPVKIAVSQTPLSSPFYIAEQLGFFKQQGIDVELVGCSGGVQCSKALLKGDVDYATASESVVMFTSFERQDFQIVVSFVQSDNDLKLLALKGDDLQSINDLRNKRIGMIKASSSEFYFDTLLLAHNLKGISIDKVYGSADQLYQQLFDKQLDAVSIWEPWGYKIDVAAHSNVTNLSLPGIYTLSFNLLAMKNTLTSDRKTAIAILQALKQAIDWMHKNPEKTQQRIALVLSIDEKQLEWSWQDYSFRLSLGNTLLTNLQLQGRWAIESQIVQGQLPDYRQLMADELLIAALQNEEIKP